MIVDSSAIIAVTFQEPGFETLLEKLSSANAPGIGAPTLVELGIALTARIGEDARPIVSRLITELELTVVPFGETHWREAVRAYVRYGKGRHAAALNFGDCMTYATAKLSAQPLLCVGHDFAKTDLDLA